MNSLYCGCRSNCTLFAFCISIIIGIVTSFLRITAVITVTPAFLWVIFGIAVGFLAISLLNVGAYDRIQSKDCICANITALLIGILGTIFGSVILLAITFVATSIIGAIITGGTLFFFFLMLISASCLIRCVLECYNI